MELVKNKLCNYMVNKGIDFRNYRDRMERPNNTFAIIEVRIYQTIRRIDFTLDRKYRGK